MEKLEVLIFIMKNLFLSDSNFYLIKLKLLFVFYLSTGLLFSQKIINVKNVEGIYIMSENITPKQAKLEAIKEAKLNALKKAGIKENLNSYSILYEQEIDNNFRQMFTSDFSSEINGAIKSFEIINQRTETSLDNIVFKVVINAKVIKYDAKKDPAFTVNINGIDPVYRNNKELEFNLTSGIKCYLSIFYVNEYESGLIYPNSNEDQIMLEPNVNYKFPQNKGIGYYLEAHQNNKNITETNRFIFVFTKKKIQFIKKDKNNIIENRNDIFSWIYSITPDQRNIEYFSIIIKK